MARYRIGNDITVLWTINDKDGKPLNLEGKEVHLYYTCERGRYEADINVQGDNANIVVWEFNGGSQRALGGYTLTLEILQSEGKRSIKKDICNAFTLVGKDCEACETHGDAWINEEGEISLVSDLDVYRISPVIPYVGPNKNWWVDGVDTGMPSVGTTAYQYAVTLGYEGSEEEYANEASAVPKLTENMRFVTEGANRAKEEALRAAERANSVIDDLNETLQTKAEKSVVEEQGAQLTELSEEVGGLSERVDELGRSIPDWNASTYKEGHIKNRTHHMQDYMCHYFKGSPIEISKPSGVGYVLLAYDTDLADKFIRIEISADESKTHEFLDALGNPLIFTWDANNSTINVESFMGAVETYDMRAYYSSSAKSYDEYFVKLDKGFLPEGAMSQISMISITYSELVALRDNGKLIAGMQYHITDYVTTTTQTDTESAGHPFDIIVTADSENTLNEVARAALHEGDTYFAEAKLEAWQIWYCIDNDTERFGWADAENGKGVIYRMIDEFDNDCPYDFKNIKFVRWELEKPTMNYAPGIFDIIIPTIISNLSPNQYKWAGSRMWDYPEEEYHFNNFFTSKLTGNTESFFTFTDEQGTTDLSLAGTSHHNTIKENTYWDDELFAGKWLNQIVLFDLAYFNNFERNCHQLTLLGVNSYNYFDKAASNIILIDARSNIFGMGTYNIFLYGGRDNYFLGYNYDIVLCTSNYNTFMKDSGSIVFESHCEHNFIGEGAIGVGFRRGCNYNVIEDDSQGIFLFSNCTHNKFRKCIDIELSGIVNSPQCNTFENCRTIRFSNGIAKYNTIKAGASNVTLVGNGTKNTDEIRYIEVDGSVQGASGSPIQVTVPVNANYSNKVAKKSDGTVVVFNEADLVN